ncbi:unnamed protein product [Blepharisma stoltei]|uniref:Exportin-7/Ran-binding protein 17 TPR repeats domain-containing protein n=1 Tax=Blepharisma stoltei TaxID=1481888 RepID=A0AAU9J0U6_9CILI|nr:unnamed protein product [Blepharisma stoltei]
MDENLVSEFLRQSSCFFSSNTEEQLPAHAYFQELVYNPIGLQLSSYVLLQDTSHQSVYLASQVLFNLITKKWSLFSHECRLSLYKHILSNLVSKGEDIYKAGNMVLLSLLRLLCRIARQSWNDSTEFTKLPTYALEFLTQSPVYICIGLQLIDTLIEDMSPSSENALTQHKRNAKQFQQDSLPALFGSCTSALALTLSESYSESDKSGIILLFLKILVNILEFGQNDAENTDFFEISPSQNPGWGTLQSIDTSRQIFELYQYMLRLSNKEAAQNCLKFQALYLSINKNFFTSQDIRISIIIQIVQGIREILQGKIGLDDETILYEFVRLVAKLTSSKALFDVKNHMNLLEFLGKIFYFTKNSIETDVPDNIIHYQLLFWDFLCPEVKTFPEDLKKCIVEITKSYITLMLTKDDRVDDEEMLLAELSVICSLSRADFEGITSWIIMKFEELALIVLTNQEAAVQLEIMVYILSVIIIENKKIYSKFVAPKRDGTIRPKASETTYEEHMINGNLAYHILQLMSYIDVNPSLKSTGLVKACLSFLRSFIKLYFNKEVSSNVSGTFTALASKLQLENESLVLSHILGKLFTHLQEATQNTYKVCLEMFSDIIDGTRLITHPLENSTFLVCGNIGFSDNNAIEILSTYSQNRFTFMDPLIINKSRRYFITAISRLYYMSNVKLSMSFEVLFSPISLCIETALQTNNIIMMQNALYDLRGVLEGSLDSDHMTKFFDWFYPKLSEPLSVFICSNWDKREIAIPFLKFLKELSFNRTERLSFAFKDSHKGFSLFKYCEKNIISFFTLILNSANPADLYTDKYKPISQALVIFTRLITSGCISLKALPKDLSIKQTLELALLSIVTIPIEDMISYVKIFKIVFELLQLITCTAELRALAFYSLPHDKSAQLLYIINEGIQSLDQSIALVSLVTLKNIVRDLCLPKEPPAYDIKLNFRMIQSEPLKKLLKTIFLMVLRGEAKNLGIINRILLGLINLNQVYYREICPELTFAQGTERQPLIVQGLEALWNNLNFNWFQLVGQDDPIQIEKNMHCAGSFEKRLEVFVKLLSQAA